MRMDRVVLYHGSNGGKSPRLRPHVFSQILRDHGSKGLDLSITGVIGMAQFENQKFFGVLMDEGSCIIQENLQSITHHKGLTVSIKSQEQWITYSGESATFV